MACGGADAPFFGPLVFPEPSSQNLPFGFSPWEVGNVTCFLCPAQFDLVTEQNHILAHLYNVHKLVIADVDALASWKGYFDYWRIRFTQIPVDKVCLIYAPTGESQYYLLSEVYSEDLDLRRGLMAKRLEWVLDCQRREREERNFGRGCIFCRYEEQGTRADYIGHLAYQHNLQLGQTANLVFIEKLIDKIEDKMVKLECIYCEHVFKDRDTLKEHMRKKFHKRINSKNKEYDKFFVKSYIDGGRGDPEDIEAEDAWSQWREEGSDWSDWQEEPTPIVCLFCTYSCREWDDILSHLHKTHKFYYKFVMGSYNFYEQVKIVNFIRREVHILRCYECKMKFPENTALTQHLAMASHCTIPDRSDWDHPEFFFPTYENDTFLSMIQDNEEDPIEKLASKMESECAVSQPVE